jgi:hypothetical protein
MTQRGISGEVLSHLTHHIGIHVSAQSLNELVPTNAFTDKQIGQALATLNRNGVVDRVGRGIYVYRGAKPNKREDEHLFETVGKLKDGSILVRSDNDEFYVLTTLEQYYGKDKV